MPPENNQPQKKSRIASLLKNRTFWGIVFSIALIGAASLFLYVRISNSRVYTDSAVISAPVISLAPATAGSLQAIYVNNGDYVKANDAVAQVGNQLIKTTVNSIVISENNDIGALFTPSQAVLTVIDPTQLRVDAQVEEDKGLSRIHVGDRVVFTVDAFGSKKYVGVIDEVSATSHQSDIVFNISDQREEQDFDVKVRFNPDQYPELKNGMSAKVWIYQ